MNEYKHVRNMVRKESRKVVTNLHVQIAASCKSSSKNVWQYIRCKSSSASGIGDLKVSDGKK